MKSRLILSLAAVFLSVLVAGVAHAGYSSYLKLEGVTGESNPPGLSDATQIRSFSLSHNSFTETQDLDSNLPTLITSSGFSDATVAFYKQPITTSEPFEKILLHDLIVSSFQTSTINTPFTESVTFQYESPADFLYLKLPGGGGVSGLIPIDSLTIADNTFSVHRAVDAASPALALALANGAFFDTSSLLVYTDTTAPPDLSFVFDHALISSIVTDASGEVPEETISFVATDSTLPEPATTALLALGVLAGVIARRSH